MGPFKRYRERRLCHSFILSQLLFIVTSQFSARFSVHYLRTRAGFISSLLQLVTSMKLSLEKEAASCISQQRQKRFKRRTWYTKRSRDNIGNCNLSPRPHARQPRVVRVRPRGVAPRRGRRPAVLVGTPRRRRLIDRSLHGVAGGWARSDHAPAGRASPGCTHSVCRAGQAAGAEFSRSFRGFFSAVAAAAAAG